MIKARLEYGILGNSKMVDVMERIVVGGIRRPKETQNYELVLKVLTNFNENC